ncbi:MAG TPA: PHP domain-containing protein [Actinophytocola sp.]|uniref:PHP domain-containing protein n=1 Tax=Actinophytocola sp. TaxID=1872138 RepID=UPI002DB5A6DC|nr:PHP domain-containing protein [Actinophytocola sp.]HEU5469637.1 PHP domain-containing protein [Actinophytocola sp.]
MRIDLHTHSTASDGTDSPAELVAAAARAGLDTVALTDHDTTAGWADAAAALPPGLRLVRGAELSCLSPDGRGGECTVHLLAYLFDPEAGAVVRTHEKSRAERRIRLRRIAERMAADGLPVDPDALLDGVPAGVTPGRPHLATVLVRAGVVSTVDEAFARYLNDRGRYYIPSNRTPVLDALAMVTASGGVSVLAHAFAHRRGPTVTAEVIAELAAAGLDGIEVDHPDHDPADRQRLRGLAADLDLLTTGSSDYHGSNKTVRLGQETTDPQMLDAIAERATGAPVLSA